MQIEISPFNEDFINQVKRVTDLPGNTIINNIINYYRAVKTVRKQYKELQTEGDRLIEFGKSEIGLLEGEELQLYLLTRIGMEEHAGVLFYEKLKKEIMGIIRVSEDRKAMHQEAEESFKRFELVS